VNMPASSPLAARGPSSGWFFRMAWRDSRRSRAKLLLFSLSIVLGIAAMVAIGSFGKNLEQAAEDQTKALLGADLMVQSRDELTDQQREFLDSLGGVSSEQVLFSSMVYFPRVEGTRLAQVGALAGEFPYYGEVETQPPDAWQRFLRGEGAVVEESVLLQFNVQVGDEIKIGNLVLPIVGALRKVPGDNEFFASLAPRVYLRRDKLDATGLIGEFSLARYRRYFKFATEGEATGAIRLAESRREELRLRLDTVQERKEDLGEALRNLYRFLNLGGFIALLLGAIGVASAIQVHVGQRLDSVAMLRCLGATARQAFLIYLIQGAFLGLAGVIAGTVVGVGLQQTLPRVFAGLIPVEVKFAVDAASVMRAALAGFFICMLFALLPLLRVRTISPLAVFRRELEPPQRRDPWLYVVYLAIIGGVLWFSLSQTEEWRHGVGFAGGLGGALLVLYLVARGMVWSVRRMAWSRLPFVWRQGLANLHRPNNRTLLLMVTLGLGSFLMLTLYLVQFSLVRELSPETQGDKPNAVLFDIQADQKAGVLQILTNQNLPVIDVSPVVTMRIQSVKGRPTQELLRGRRGGNWVLRREYRSSYRANLSPAEQLLAGEWIGHASPNDERIPVSIEESIVRELDLKLGDEVVFDVQGVPMKTRLASIRKVEWRRVQANFFVVFPVGVLEEAPGFSIVTTHVNGSQQSAAMQREVVRAFPNVSSVDFTLILGVIENIVSKISIGIRFIALLTVGTGIILLVTAVLNSRFQRLREVILLRTLGASAAQIVKIQVVEFLLLGVLASLTGIALAVLAQWTLTNFVFKIGFVVPWAQLALAVVANATLAVVIGLLASRNVLNRPPLEVLRAEA
jgi:putative ABC transport system permease protein